MAQVLIENQSITERLILLKKKCSEISLDEVKSDWMY